MVDEENIALLPSSGDRQKVESSIVRQFAEQREKYVGFCDSMRTLVLRLCESQGIHVTIEARTKEVSHLREKLNRKSHYEKVSDIPDLVGVRVIARYSSEVRKIAEILSREFETIDESRHTFQSPETFGYQSHHLVVTLNANRTRLPEWKDLRGLRCEIQVRTTLQHAWAAISHSVDYKAESDVPPALRRDLFKIAALLESADDGFERYRIDVENLQKKYDEEKNWQLLPVDIYSLRSHWQKLPWLHLLEGMEKAGARITKNDKLIVESVALGIARASATLRLLTLGELADFLQNIDGSATLVWVRENLNEESQKGLFGPAFAIFTSLMGPGGINTSKDRNYVLGLPTPRNSPD